MDLQSSVLLSLKIQSTSISRWFLSEPWGVEVVDFSPGYCLSVVEGRCWVELAAGKLVELLPGDSLLAPRGGACSLASSPGAARTSINHLPWVGEEYHGLEGQQPTTPAQVTWGGGGATTQLLGVAFTLQSGMADFVLSQLSQFMILRRKEAGILPLTLPAMEFLIDDTNPGYFAVARHLSELIVISLLRAHIFSADSHTTGWLRGMQDPSVARVLSTIHAHPQRAWTVSKLASAGNMSRSAFSERFSRLTGFSPIQYLNQWRIGLAADRLRTTRQSMDTIAQAVGYQSDRAFRRAFRQQFGMSPLQYRKQFREQES